MAKQVLDVHAGKGMTTSQSNEHLRNANTGERLKKWSGNYDPSREKLNFEVGPGGIIVPVDKKSSIPSRIKKILKQRGVVDPNKGLPEARYRTVANVILGGSRDQMHRLAFGSQEVNLEPGSDNAHIRRMPEIESWALDMYKFMSKSMVKRISPPLLYTWMRRIPIFIVRFFLSPSRISFHGER